MPDERPVAIANTSPLQYMHQCGLSGGLSDLFARLLPLEREASGIPLIRHDDRPLPANPI